MASDEATTSAPIEMLFTSLGTITLDEIHLPSGEIWRDVIGGTGVYASLGARLFCPRQFAKQVGYIIRKGDNFPPERLEELKLWGMSLIIQDANGSPATRGRIRYLDPTLSTKSFELLAPVLLPEPVHLVGTSLLSSRTFHFIADPTQIVEQTDKLLRFRSVAAGLTTPPIVIWEPRPRACVPENYEAFLAALSVVDVFSPSLQEIASIAGGYAGAEPVDEEFFEWLCNHFILGGNDIFQEKGTVIVRTGDRGCFIKNKRLKRWLPGYHPSSKVVDAVGAGDAFLGAFGVNLQTVNDKELLCAACAGNIGASFAVEQIGMPNLSVAEDGRELWNGENAMDRFFTYLEQLEFGVALSSDLNKAG